MIFTKQREETFLALSDESQQKVVKIYEIAVMYQDHKMRQIDSAEFDYLYDLEYRTLCYITQMYKARLNNIEGE